jgi:hypothetical protein
MPYRGYRRTRGYDQKLGLVNLVIRRCPRSAVGGANVIGRDKGCSSPQITRSVFDLPLRYKLLSAQAKLRDLLIAVANPLSIDGVSNLSSLLSSR